MLCACVCIWRTSYNSLLTFHHLGSRDRNLVAAGLASLPTEPPKLPALLPCGAAAVTANMDSLTPIPVQSGTPFPQPTAPTPHSPESSPTRLCLLSMCYTQGAHLSSRNMVVTLTATVCSLVRLVLWGEGRHTSKARHSCLERVPRAYGTDRHGREESAPLASSHP